MGQFNLELKDMNKKALTIIIFSAGFAIGAIASEISSNGLYIFKSGDSIVADEVNSNFELLNKRITIIEKTYAITDNSWNCEGDEGGYANLRLEATGSIHSNDSLTPTQDATAWTYSYENDTFTLNSSQEYEATISLTSDNNIRVIPLDDLLESYTCSTWF